MSAPTTAFVKQYQSTITLLAQQMDTRLQIGCNVDMDWVGEEKYYDQYAEDDMVEIISRNADTPIQETDHRRRKVTPRYFVSNTLEDPFEALAMLADPKSTYMQAKMASANRKKDAIIIEALGGTSYSGKAGGTSNVLAAANKIAVAATGLTKDKLLEASAKLNSEEIPKNDRYVAFTSTQLTDLLKSTEATSDDYNVVKTLVQGDIKTWIGFEFLHSEQLAVDGSDDRLCYAWQKNGMQLAIQKNPSGRIDERPDKNYAWQVYMKIVLGAVRLEERYVVQIACSE